MANPTVTSQSVDYVQRCLVPPPEAMGGPSTAGAPETRRLLRVLRVGRPDVELERRAIVLDGQWRPHTVGLITGLYGYRIPLAFKLVGAGDQVRVELGTWSAKPAATSEGQDRRRGVIVRRFRRGRIPPGAAVPSGRHPDVAGRRVVAAGAVRLWRAGHQGD